MNNTFDTSATVIATELSSALDPGGFLCVDAWNSAQPVCFASDWQGKNEDPARQTEVRVLWTQQTLHLKFRCRYRSLTVFEDSATNGRRDQLWDRDVAEVFLQPNPAQPHRYWEFEVSPNGMWIDLEISLDSKSNAESGMKSRVVADAFQKIWTAELALPMHSLTNNFDPTTEWRVNFFRVEGPAEPRFYSSWQPTHTAQPNFHMPEAFGLLRFQKA